MRSIKGQLQQFAGAMMVPIILLVCVGLYVGIGAAFTNYILPENNPFTHVAKAFVDIGFIFMRLLPMWFAVGIAFTLARQEKGWAALNGLVLFFSTHAVISSWARSNGMTADTMNVSALVQQGVDALEAEKISAIWTTFAGVFTVDAGIFLAIICGLLAALIQNRSIGISVPQMLSFFGGPRLGIIISTVVAVPLGILVFYVWPFIASGLQALTYFITASGLFGTFLFGTLDKMLLPLGLHHLIAFPIEYTRIGGTMIINGELFEGVRNIMAGQAADLSATGYITRNFTTGRALFQFGGIPGMGLAMYHVVNPKNRKKAAAIIIPAVLTAMIVGISEPFEYTFVFVAPAIYYFVYAPLSGLAYVLMEAMGASFVGQGGLFMIPNLFQPHKVNIIPLLIMLPVYFALYYFIFKFLINRFSVPTPGRNLDSEDVRFITKDEVRGGGKIKLASPGALTESAATNYSQPDLEATVATVPLELRIVNGLGGAENVEEVSCCATRLRITVKDVGLVANDSIWRDENEAMGVLRNGQYIQVIYGPHVITLTSKVKEIIGID